MCIRLHEHSKEGAQFRRPIAIGERPRHVPASHATLVSAPSRDDSVHRLCGTRSSISHANYRNTVFDEVIALSSVNSRRPYDKGQRAIRSNDNDRLSIRILLVQGAPAQAEGEWTPAEC